MSDSNNNIDVTTKKRLMLPLSATYTLNNTNGFADGIISVTVDLDNNSATDIVSFWADDKGKLEDYNSLYPFRITGKTTVFEVGKCILIPKNASRLLLFSLDYNTGEITDDYYEITLPKEVSLKEEFGKIITEFQVVSDVHISTESDNAFYIKMLERITEISPKSVGLFISGDVTNTGRINEYQKQNMLFGIFLFDRWWKQIILCVERLDPKNDLCDPCPVLWMRPLQHLYYQLCIAG